MDFTNLDDVVNFGDYLSSFKKSEIKKIFEYLLKIRDLGVVNMFQSGNFLFMTKGYFDDFMRLESYKKDFDEDHVEEVSDMVDEIRDIMVRAGVRYIENQGKDVEVRSVEGVIRRLITSTVKYFMMGALKNVE